MSRRVPNSHRSNSSGRAGDAVGLNAADAGKFKMIAFIKQIDRGMLFNMESVLNFADKRQM